MSQDSYYTLILIVLIAFFSTGISGIFIAKNAIKQNKSDKLKLAGFLIGLGIPIIGMIFVVEWLKKSIAYEADRKAIHAGAVKGFGLSVALGILLSIIPIETQSGGIINSSDYNF